MSPLEELTRKALLHDQAATLLRENAEDLEAEVKQLRDKAARHDAVACRLRKEAALLGRKKRITDLWVIIKQTPLRFSLWRLERKIDRGWNPELSLQIDQIHNSLEGTGHDLYTLPALPPRL